MYYLNMYFIGSFLGYLIETFLKTLVFHSMNNGILYGPWIPLYGIGIVISILVTKKIFKMKIKNILKFIISFIIIFIIITIIEETSGLLIEYFFHTYFWKYDKLFLNIGHYISIEMSIIWGIVSLLFICYLKPILDLFIKKIPKILTLGILLLHILDIITTWLT